MVKTRLKFNFISLTVTLKLRSKSPKLHILHFPNGDKDDLLYDDTCLNPFLLVSSIFRINWTSQGFFPFLRRPIWVCTAWPCPFYMTLDSNGLGFDKIEDY